MNEVYQSNPEGLNINKDDYNAVNLSNTIDIIHRRSSETESTEELIEKKFPPTDYFWWIKLNKIETYNIPWNPKRLERTGKRCGTNPTYENSLVMTRNGEIKRMNHYETYYTDKDVFSNGNPKFPVSNIEWRIRSVLNADRERKWLDRIPENQKVRNYGADWTIRDMNWYIVVAANLNTYPRWTLIMTTLWPWRVYDTWKLATNHIDIFTHWEV